MFKEFTPNSRLTMSRTNDIKQAKISRKLPDTGVLYILSEYYNTKNECDLPRLLPPIPLSKSDPSRKIPKKGKIVKLRQECIPMCAINKESSSCV
jgi:hypothetical protein